MDDYAKGGTPAIPIATDAEIRSVAKQLALAGILFSILLIIVFSLLRMSVPADPQESGAALGVFKFGRVNASLAIGRFGVRSSKRSGPFRHGFSPTCKRSNKLWREASR